MKQRAKQLLVWMWLMLPLIASAQSALNDHSNVPRPGDRLIKQQVLHKSPGRSGNSVCWDFSDLKVTDAEYELRYDTLRNNYWIGREHRTMYYYTLQNDTFSLCGHENPTSLFVYRKPEIQLVLSFDKIGNIKLLSRNGLLSQPSTFRLIDNLTNTYVGNQLRSTISYVTNAPYIMALPVMAASLRNYLFIATMPTVTLRKTKVLGRAFSQSDGGEVYLHEITPGRFNAVV